MKTFLFIFLAGYTVRCDDSNYFVVQMLDTIPTKHFQVYWNVPTMQCKSKKILFEDLQEKYGIIQNTDDTFRGDKISILYDPGDFPALLRNSTSGEIKYRNGGVPQEGDLIEHLDTFQNVLEQSVPDKNFNGVGIIDFESWRPVLRQNFGVLTPYKDVSYAIEKKRHWWWKKQKIEEEAKRRFEDAAREFMQATISLAKKMRPRALWGYYGFPYCFNMAYNNRRLQCADKVPQENDRINWLWKESTALYPSVYSTEELTSSQLASLIKGRVNEAARVARGQAPILPYFWYRYRDQGFFSESDLHVAINTFYNSNATGFIIWGSSNDVNTVEKCEKLKQYVTDILGPAVAKYTKPIIRQKDELDETNAIIYNPSNASKYDPEYTWIPPVNYTQKIEEMVDKELQEEKQTKIIHSESILIDMILHMIANYCADGCNNKSKERSTDEKDGSVSESTIVLVTEDPFKKNSSVSGVTVPTTTEDDIYDYDITSEGVTDKEFYERDDYLDISTTSNNTEEATSTTIKIIDTTISMTIQSTEETSSNTEDISTLSKEYSTINDYTTEASNIVLSTEQTNAVDVDSYKTSTTDLTNNTNDISTTEFLINDTSTTEGTTTSNIENTSPITKDFNFTENFITKEPEISLVAEESSTEEEDGAAADTSDTYSNSVTTISSVLTEQVVVSVV